MIFRPHTDRDARQREMDAQPLPPLPVTPAEPAPAVYAPPRPWWRLAWAWLTGR